MKRETPHKQDSLFICVIIHKSRVRDEWTLQRTLPPVLTPGLGKARDDEIPFQSIAIERLSLSRPHLFHSPIAHCQACISNPICAAYHHFNPSYQSLLELDPCNEPETFLTRVIQRLTVSLCVFNMSLSCFAIGRKSFVHRIIPMLSIFAIPPSEY